MSLSKAPRWFTIVAILALIWNLMGVYQFYLINFISEEALSKLSPDEQSMYTDVPLWANIAFAFAVFGGTLGSIGLVMKKKWAKPILLISLIAILVQMSYNLFISKAMDVYGPGAIAMPIMILIIGLYLIWMANHGMRKGWLS